MHNHRGACYFYIINPRGVIKCKKDYLIFNSKTVIMKRILFVCSLVMAAINYTSAQSLPEVSLITLPNAQSLVYNFQHSASPIRHPSSFLILAKEIKDYLGTTQTPLNNCYLHVYLASKNADGTGVFAVVMGTVYISSAIVHDPTMDNFLCSSLAEPYCCTNFDPSLDVTDHNDIYPCDRNNCIKTEYTPSEIKTYFRYYQDNHPAPNSTQSFLFNANELRSYLLANASVKYLQIYLGKDLALQTVDKLTLVITGVDNYGDHIPVPTLLGDCVFNECIPCPKCYVRVSLGDHKPQFQGPTYHNVYNAGTPVPKTIKKMPKTTQK